MNPKEFAQSTTLVSSLKTMQFPTDFNANDQFILSSVVKEFPLVQDPFNQFSAALCILLCRHVNPNITIAIDQDYFSCHFSESDTFESVLNYLNDKKHYSKEGKASILISSVPTNLNDTVFAINMLPSIRDLKFKVSLQYNAAIFKQDRMSDILSQLKLILDAPKSMNIHDIDLKTEYATSVLPDPTADLHWNEWPGSIIQLFHKNAKNNNNRFVIQQLADKDIEYSYNTIYQFVNQISNHLSNNKLEKSDVVSIFAHRGVDLVVAILGILGAHCVVNIIDPLYPPERQITLLSVAKPKAIIHLNASGALHSDVTEYISSLNCKCQISNLATGESLTADGELNKTQTPIDLNIQPTDPATLSFTSGSTGTPKGVLGMHFSLTHFYPWMAQEFNLSNKDRFTMLSGIAHDPIQRDIFTPIFLQAELYIPHQTTIHSNPSLWIHQNQITVTHLTPAMGQLVTHHPTAIPSLKNAFFVGDVLTKRDVISLQRIAPNVTIINMYGTTETQRSVSYLKITTNVHLMKPIMHAGKGMKDVQLLLLNNNRLCGIGELGEIYVRSCGLARGYLNADNFKFQQNPFSTKQEDRCYKTGDLARYLPDGSVECVGRLDDQIKIRGFRIELGDIDTPLSEYPGVVSNVTLLKRDENEEHQLISWIVGKVEVKDVLSYLRGKLPHYSVPNHIVILDKLPLTPNGKIDKNRLQLPLADAKTPIDIQDPIQLQLATILSKLNISLTPQDDLFAAGLHSILATKLLYELQLLNYSVTMQHLYQFNTIELLADYLKMESTPISFDYTAQVKPLREELQKMNELKSKVGPTNEYKHILLTGATGYLGSFILQSLLQLNCTIYCLVRGNDPLTKLQQTAGGPFKMDNVRLVKGDLSAPKCGLSTADYDMLASTIDVVIHNGALVHWVYPYQHLYNANVGSTIELYKLCTIHHIKPFHFVSSTSVISNMTHCDETNDLSTSTMITSGYGQSKWVCEQILRDQPIPVCIIRPGYIVGHSKTGITNSDDFIFRLIQGCQELKRAPIINNHINMCTVDYVSAVVVASVVCQNKSILQCWQPMPFTFTELFATAAHYMDIQPLEYMKWKELLELNVTDGLMPLLHFVMDDLPTSTKGCILGDENTRKLMKQMHQQHGKKIENDSMQNTIVGMLSYLIDVGYYKLEKGEAASWKGLATVPYKELLTLEMWKDKKQTFRSNK